MSAGIRAIRAATTTHRYVCAKAALMPARVARWSRMPFCRITVKTATPSEPPTRCRTLSIGVARGTWRRSSVAYAAAIAGIIEPPKPKPRTTSPRPSTQYGVPEFTKGEEGEGEHAREHTDHH